MCGNVHTGRAGQPAGGGGWGAGGGGVAMDGCAVLALHSDAVFMEPLIAQVGARPADQASRAAAQAMSGCLRNHASHSALTGQPRQVQ
jgi:hypothetical protein